MIQRRSTLTWLSALPLLATGNNFAQVVNLTDAVNKAGRQRMLAQRAGKAYFAIGMGIAVPKAQEILNQSMTQFDRQLIELKAFSPTPEIKATYGEMESVWSDYKTALIGQVPKRETAQALIDIDGKLLALANKGASALEQLVGKPIGKLVNVAGRQRGLSQRVAKLYLAMAWKAPISGAQAELNTARADFSAALDLLSKAPETTAQIKEELDQARNQWVFYDSALTLKAGESAAPERGANVFTSSENILSVMEKVTGMYVRAGA
jgi:Type IV pili methyl-accepting chemotaxis transducer N-term